MKIYSHHIGGHFASYTDPEASVADVDPWDDTTVFLSSPFAEDITYTPHGGTPVVIKAVVDREPQSVQSHGRQPGVKSAQLVYEISIGNKATIGMTSVKERFDTVTLPKQIGGSATVIMTVQKILSQDAGMWKLEVAS